MVKKNINNQIRYVVDTSQKILPNFLVDKNIETIDSKDIYIGYSLVGDFLDKTILRPNNRNYPTSRNDFVNELKWL